MTNMLFSPKAPSKRGTFKYALSNAGDTPGDILAVANPLGKACVVTDVQLRVTTEATGACTIDAGIAANGTTSSNTLIDGQDVGTAAGLWQGTVDEWGASEFLTISTATGAVADLVGDIYVELMLV